MIKTISSIALAGLVATSFTGCGGAKPAPEPEVYVKSCKQENVLAPAWACEPFLEGSYAGLGVAAKSKAGYGFTRKIALANGRSDLAQQIESKVKDMVKTFTQSIGTGSSETVDQVNLAASKQVASVALKGSKQVDSWTAPSGTLYLLVAVPESVINGAAKKAVKTSMKNDEALWQQFQAKNAHDELDKAFPTD